MSKQVAYYGLVLKTTMLGGTSGRNVINRTQLMDIVCILCSDKVSRMDSRCPDEDSNGKPPTTQFRSSKME